MEMTTEKKRVDSFLENYKNGDELKLSLTPGEKGVLAEYVLNHDKGGKDFVLVPGVFKPHSSKQDFRLRKRI